MRKLLFILFLLQMLFTQTYNNLDSINWLLGSWVAEDDKNITFETWKQVSPKSYEGIGKIESKNPEKKASVESMRLVEMTGEIYFIAKVSHNKLPISFKLLTLSDKLIIFENVEHDFPKRIEYHKNGKNDLVVSVNDGAGKGFKVNFKRK